MSTAPMDHLRLEEITKFYDKVLAVDRLSISIERGIFDRIVSVRGLYGAEERL